MLMKCFSINIIKQSLKLGNLLCVHDWWLYMTAAVFQCNASLERDELEKKGTEYYWVCFTIQAQIPFYRLNLSKKIRKVNISRERGK